VGNVPYVPRDVMSLCPRHRCQQSTFRIPFGRARMSADPLGCVGAGGEKSPATRLKLIIASLEFKRILLSTSSPSPPAMPHRMQAGLS
jgi:hypothetical protein